jgi:acyl transferase domain-containing protein/acyl carrier protein
MGFEVEPIAIVGLGCRFPRAADPRQFWQVLRDGVDCVGEVRADRRKNFDFEQDPALRGKEGLRRGGFLDRVDLFDPHFFRISPREAVRMDPQQRLMLEVVWEALEDAGQCVKRLARSRVGVFVGVMNADHAHLNLRHLQSVDTYAGAGSSTAIVASRISYSFDFQGPSLVVDTLCSSSLVAVHLACQSLWSGDSSPLAVAGGVNVILLPTMSLFYARSGLTSTDGRCKSFDARADGIVRGEGAGAVVLKLLSRAVADNDPVYCVIRGSAVNQDGRSNGLTAPSRWSQIEVLREAYRRAGVSPSRVDYVETHGTGTPLGDPIEATALGTVLAEGRAGNSRCAIGSVKTNFGHLESAAGIASLIKTALMLKHREVPPSLHFRSPNPSIPFDRLRLRVQTALEAWPQTSGSAVAGVSSFGLGGTNVHVVLEEAPESHPPPRAGAGAGREAQLLTLSAHNDEALRVLARALREERPADESDGPVSLEDLCYTSGARRTHHDYRLALVCRSQEESAECLDAFLRGDARPGLSRGRVVPGRRDKVVFVFSGQGQQWCGMGRELLEREPVFRTEVGRCDEAFGRLAGWSLLQELARAPEDEGGRARLEQTEFAQPILFALQVGLASVWLSWGVRPEAVVGHSLGEVAAAHVAGALSLEDAVRVVFQRGRLMQRAAGGGKMAAVELTPSEAEHAMAGHEGRLSIAAHNGPQATVISGDARALEGVMRALAGRGVYCKLLPVEYAFHSPQMEAFQDELRDALRGIEPRSCAVPVYSTVTGQPLDGRLFDAAYWASQMREPVRFAPAVERLLAEDNCCFVEVGAHPVLSWPLRQCLRQGVKSGTAHASLRRGEGAHAVMLGTLGALYCLGHEVSWDGLYPNRGRSVRFPLYPWQRERLWWDAEAEAEQTQRPAPGGEASGHPLLGSRFSPARPIGQHFWQTRLDPEALPYLQDHRIREELVFPGTGYIEMALTAGAEAFGTRSLSLLDVEFRQALYLRRGEARVLQTALTPEGGDSASFSIYSSDAPTPGKQSDWTLHASGRVCRCAEKVAAPVSGLPSAEAAGDGARQTLGSDFYEGLRRYGLNYGPAFQGVAHLSQDGDATRGRVLAPAPLSSEPDSYHLHPALLDACLQVGWSRLPQLADPAENARSFMPVRINRVNVHGRLEPSMWSYARRARLGPYELEEDVQIVDESGVLLVEFEGVCARGVEVAGRRDSAGPDELLYELNWRPKERAGDAKNSSPDACANWLIFADHGGVGEALSELLKGLGSKTLLVYAGVDSEPEREGVVRIDPARPYDLEDLFARLPTSAEAGRRGIVHLWSLDATLASRLTAATLAALQDEGSVSVLSMVAALTREASAGTSRLWLVTRGAQAVTGVQQPAMFAQAAVWGLGRTLAGENPSLWGGLVDLEADTNAREAASLLLDELLSPDGEDQLAFRNGRRYVARLARRRRIAGQTSEPRFRSDASYLITGGLGGLGLAVARYMLERGARHLVLLGRTALPTHESGQVSPEGEGRLTKAAAVRELEAAGASIYTAACDVADERQMVSFVEGFRRDGLPPLRGVVHAAGALSDKPLAQLSAEELLATLRPKMIGGWLLHQLLLDAPLDFFVLFSSASSILSSPTLGGYAAANAALDALAHYRRARGLTALTINWGAWAEVGMAARAAGERAHAGRAFGSLAPAEALNIFGRLLAEDATQAAVMSVDWNRWRRRYPSASGAPLLVEVDGVGAEVRAVARAASEPESPTRESLLVAGAGERRALVESLLRECVARVLMLPPSQLDSQVSLGALGLDSLMAVEVRNFVEQRLGVILPMAALLQDPSIARLADQLLEHLAAAGAGGARTSDEAAGARTRDACGPLDVEGAEQLLSRLDQLSDEQVDGLLGDLMVESAVGGEQSDVS